MSPLGRGCCGWREASASNCNDGALSPQKPGMLWSLRSSLAQARKNASSSIFMPSSEGNISAKAGDVVVGMKRTMKVWSMGLFAGIRRCGVLAW